jgi:hydrogenase maturation factor
LAYADSDLAGGDLDPPGGSAVPPACPGDVCITCSDQAVQVRVVERLADGLARVDTGAGTEEVSVALVDAVVGDTVLVHAKEAIAVLSRGAPGDS